MFYISSRGSSASEWLAKMLSRHPQIVCFRSTRRLPPYTHGSKDSPQLSADAFMEGLLECEQATYGEKIFGSVHGYHGLRAKDPCEKRGGTFSYIIRHPVSRIHSAYIYYLYIDYYQKYKNKIENKDIHERVCSDLLANSNIIRYTKYTNIPKPEAVLKFHEQQFREQKPGQDLLKPSKVILKKILPEYLGDSLRKMNKRISQIKKRLRTYGKVLNDTKSQPDERFFAGLLFVALNREFLNYDSMLFMNCSFSQGIKMEEMVNSSEYFKNHIRKRVAPQLNFADSYLESIFSEQRFNVHRDKPLSPYEIWQSWPDGMKKVVLKYFENYDIWSICKGFEYDVSFM